MVITSLPQEKKRNGKLQNGGLLQAAVPPSPWDPKQQKFTETDSHYPHDFSFEEEGGNVETILCLNLWVEGWKVWFHTERDFLGSL